MGELYRLASADYISEFSDKRKVLSIALLEQMKTLADSLSCDYTDCISNLSAGKKMSVPQRWRALEEGVGILERLRCLSIDGEIILHRESSDDVPEYITRDVYAGSEEKGGIKKITKGDDTWEDPKEFFEWWANLKPGAGLLQKSFKVHYGNETTKVFGKRATLGLEGGYYDAQAIYNYLRG